MDKEKRTFRWTILSILLVSCIAVLILSIRFFGAKNYKLIDIENSIYYSIKVKNTMDRSYDITLDKPNFIDLVDKARRDNVLNINGGVREIDANHYFVRGFKRYKKSFISRILSFNYWYIVVEIESNENQLDIRSKWYQGDLKGPVQIQNYNSEPPERIKVKEKEIHSDLDLIVADY